MTACVQVHRPVEHNAPDRLPILHRHLGEGLVRPDRGVVDQDVDTAELGQRPRRHRVDLVLLGDVGDDGDRLDPEVADFARDRVGLGLVGAGVDDDVRAFPASFNAVARPILRPEPVIRATLPSSLPISAPP